MRVVYMAAISFFMFALTILRLTYVACNFSLAVKEYIYIYLSPGKLTVMSRWEVRFSLLDLDIFSCEGPCICLQCFDAVGWAAGRASGL